MTTKKNHSLAPEEIIAEIIDCALKWISEDADHPDTPPKHWQEVIPAMEHSPDLQKAAEKVVACWSRGDLAVAVRQLSDIVDVIKEGAP